MKLLIALEQPFLKIYFCKAERGEGYGVEKITKIKPTRVLVTCFDEFHRLYNLYIIGLCFVVPWFSFKHAEVWRFFNLTNKIFTKKYCVEE